METIQLIKNHPTYKEILKDSFGGVMYNVANQGKYDEVGTLEIKALWQSLDEGQKDMAGGIMEGAMGFLNENN